MEFMLNKTLLHQQNAFRD